MGMLFSGGCGHCWDSPCTCEPDAPWRAELAAKKEREKAEWDAMSNAERRASFSRSIPVSDADLRDDAWERNADLLTTIARDAAVAMDDGVRRLLLSSAAPVPLIDAEGAVPAPAEDEKPIEVSGGEVKVDVGVQEFVSAVTTGGATTEADLGKADVSTAAVGVDAAGGLAGDDAGEQHGVEQVVPGLEADKVGDDGSAPSA
jgi:hypothetical protein